MLDLHNLSRFVVLQRKQQLFPYILYFWRSICLIYKLDPSNIYKIQDKAIHRILHKASCSRFQKKWASSWLFIYWFRLCFHLPCWSVAEIFCLQKCKILLTTKVHKQASGILRWKRGELSRRARKVKCIANLRLVSCRVSSLISRAESLREDKVPGTSSETTWDNLWTEAPNLLKACIICSYHCIGSYTPN